MVQRKGKGGIHKFAQSRTERCGAAKKVKFSELRCARENDWCELPCRWKAGRGERNLDLLVGHSSVVGGGC